MLAQDHHPRQVPEPGAEACPRCGTIAAPTVAPGTGPHACQASCQHCGRHWRWVSLLSPSERQARRAMARLAAMQQHPPSEAQLEYLRALGDQVSPPQTMGEASQRIEALRQRRVLP